MHKRATSSAAAVMLAATMGAGVATTATAEPNTWLPDAILKCPGSSLLSPQEWVVMAGTDTVWINTGPAEGHYVILSHEHYRVAAYREAALTSYDGLTSAGAPGYFGEKTGLRQNSITCDFVSRCGAQNDPKAFSIVGPMVLSKVSG